MALLSGLTLAIVAVVGLRTPSNSAADLRSRALPAQIALWETAAATSQGQENLLVAIDAQDSTERAVAITAAQEAARLKDASWRTYEGLGAKAPGERTLQLSYTESSSRAVQLSAAIFSLAPSDPARAATIDAERREYANQLSVLATLQSSIYGPMVNADAAAVHTGIGTARAAVLLAYGVMAAVLSLGGVLLLIGARRETRQFAAETAALRSAGQTADFAGSLQRGLEMATTEDLAVNVVGQALSLVAPDVPVELLLADSSRAHFRQVLSTDAEADAACGVGAPRDCPAARTGQMQLFADSSDLDTCQFLRDQVAPVWAICVPVSIAGRAVGVIRAQRSLDRQPPATVADGLELVARKAGDRIGAIRVLARTEAQAQIDPVTGLPNRRTLEGQVHEFRIPEGPYVVAFADLDHFKLINDVYGHAMGDRALRLFARVLRDSIRPRDLLARYGGEEFVAVLPDCSLADASLVANRIRSELASRLAPAAVPSFTVTIGLAAAAVGDELLDVIAVADATMLRGKSLGRDRVLVAEPVIAGIGPAPIVIGDEA
ncbi:MAG TPA: GGDEF domain-containing protein [Ilumatobacteraceae bacterium]|nr:GGDEF domain-containing protein [Ilumatobacteraceae bacterium]